jgi:hypothetical protein
LQRAKYHDRPVEDDGSTRIPNVTKVVAKELASFVAAVSISASLAKVSVSLLHSLTEYQPIKSFCFFLRVRPALNLRNFQFRPQSSFVLDSLYKYLVFVIKEQCISATVHQGIIASLHLV